jgi:hypothetical protein
MYIRYVKLDFPIIWRAISGNTDWMKLINRKGPDVRPDSPPENLGLLIHLPQ